MKTSASPYLRSWYLTQKQEQEALARKNRKSWNRTFVTWLFVILSGAALATCGQTKPITQSQIDAYRLEKAVAGSFPWPDYQVEVKR